MFVSAEEFQSRFSSYCRLCEATGLTRQVHKQGHKLAQCPQCFERGECPRCRTPMRHASFCASCDWEIDEKGLAHPGAALFVQVRLQKVTVRPTAGFSLERGPADPEEQGEAAAPLVRRKADPAMARG